MTLSDAQRAELLVQAMPYIREYRGKTIAVKYGGNAMVSEKMKEQVMEDIALLHMIGVQVVLIHGGGPEINAALERIGKTPRFIDGLRVTDRETIDVVQAVLAGKVNKSLVSLLQSKGARAVGLCGIDARMIQAVQRDPELGYVGRVTGVDVTLVEDVMAAGYVPVISTLGCDEAGNVYNINADTAASYIAGAIGAERLFMMTDVPGILRDRDDPGSLIPCVDIDDAVKLFSDGVIAGGMIPKVECCIDAINRGVGRVIIMDGRVSHSILLEILTNEGAGTMVMERKDGNDDEGA